MYELIFLLRQINKNKPGKKIFQFPNVACHGTLANTNVAWHGVLVNANVQ
jgi:hypothetical protein